MLRERLAKAENEEAVLVATVAWMDEFENGEVINTRALMDEAKADFDARLLELTNAEDANGERERVLAPPGTRVLSLLALFISRRKMDRIVRPHISDMQFEYFDELQAQGRAKAAFVLVRGYATLAWALWGSFLRWIMALAAADSVSDFLRRQIDK